MTFQGGETARRKVYRKRIMAFHRTVKDQSVDEIQNNIGSGDLWEEEEGGWGQMDIQESIRGTVKGNHF